MIRKLSLKCHRYVGLSLAVPLICIAVSGSILSVDPELDALLNPDLFGIDEVGGESLTPSEIARRVEATDERIRVR